MSKERKKERSKYLVELFSNFFKKIVNHVLKAVIPLPKP